MKVWTLPERAVFLLPGEEGVVVVVVVVGRAGLVVAVVVEEHNEWIGRIDIDICCRHPLRRRRRRILEELEEVGGALEVGLLAFPRYVLTVVEGLKELSGQE